MFTVLLIVALFALVAAFGWWMYKWQYDRADQLLNDWARKNELEIVAKQNANPPGTGPSDRTAANKQVMFRVTVKDNSGKLRTGLIKVGSESAGTLSDQVTATWDDAP